MHNDNQEPVPHPLAELAELAGAELRGDGNQPIVGVATLQNAQPGTISFLANRRYRAYLATTAASAVILTEENAAAFDRAVLVTANPYLAYARVAAAFQPADDQAPGIHPRAFVDPSAKVDPTASVGPNAGIGADVVIGPGAVIGPGCQVQARSTIGAGTRLVANVTVCHDVTIGERCLIHPGVVVGADGFGIAEDHGVWTKVPQLGSVRIHDDVEIGANTTIDRGALEDTVIEDGVKLDNLIQVAHNVHIGAHTAIAGCTGISGSVTIGRYCRIGGGVGIAGHLEVADGCVITGMSFITKSIRECGVYSSGIPIDDNRRWDRTLARIRRLDGMAKKIRDLETRLRELEKTQND